MKLSPNNSLWKLFIYTVNWLHLLAVSHFLTFLPMVPEIMSQTIDLKTWSQGLEFPNLTHTLRYRKKSFLSCASCFLGPYSSSPLPLSLCMYKGIHEPKGTGLHGAQPHPCSKIMGCHNSQSKVL